MIGELNGFSRVPARGGGARRRRRARPRLSRLHRRLRDGHGLADSDGDRHRLRARRARRVRPLDPDPRRVFLLALAVIDDLIAILIIAFFFTTDANLGSLGFAAIAIALFGAVSRVLRPRSEWILARRRQWPIVAMLVVLAVLAWYFVYRSGVHATIAGVALGLVMSRRPGVVRRMSSSLVERRDPAAVRAHRGDGADPAGATGPARSGVLGDPRRPAGRQGRRYRRAGLLGGMIARRRSGTPSPWPTSRWSARSAASDSPWHC